VSLTFEKMASQREKVDADFSVRQRNTTRASKGRDLHLDDGEALFRVAKNLAHPFRVHTPQATIEAKGTQFNIDVINDTTVVTCSRGTCS
jgi:transmembrane sensor